MRFDHVILATSDLDHAGDLMLERHGLASVRGGEHAGLGTGNRIVPLGSGYVELLGVVDPDLAARNPLGQRIGREGTPEGRPSGWCLEVYDIGSVAERIGSVPVPMSRVLPDGSELSWRLAGLERSLELPHVPFFISWDDPARHPGCQHAPHRVAPRGIAWVEVSGDRDALEPALAGAALPVRVAAGPSAVVAVGVETDAGVIVLR